MPPSPATLKPSVCVDAVFEGVPIEQAMEAVRRCGIEAFEFWGWWDKDLDLIGSTRQRLGLHLAACCTKFFSLVDPAQREDYLAGLEESIAAAHRLECPTLISQVGDALPGVSRQEQLDSMVEGLRRAAPLLDEAGVTLVIEPLNVLVDHPGYFLVRSEEAFDIVDRVGSPRVKVVFDVYHQQISEGHLIERLTGGIDRIGHFHAAGNPGRHELTRGELHYPSIFEAIRQAGYRGYVGLEYWPTTDPEAGLREVAGWFANGEAA